MTSSLITLAVDREHTLPVPSYVFGLGALLIFFILMMGLLMFGKGRPHT